MDLYLSKIDHCPMSAHININQYSEFKGESEHALE